MSSIGVFREGEIDGKPFHIFAFLSQPNIPASCSSSGVAAIDSGGDSDLSLSPLFLCPSTRRGIEMLTREENGYSEDDVLPFSTSPIDFGQLVQRLLEHNNKKDLPFDSSPKSDISSDHSSSHSDISSDDQEVQYRSDEDGYSHICKLPLVPLYWCSEERVDDKAHCNYCHSCANRQAGGNSYYICVTCDEMFHKECVESPLFIKHPSYPFLSLQLYSPPTSYPHLWSCTTCGSTLNDFVYYCPTNNFKLHPFCAMQPIPIFIDHLKRHPHSLTFFPKQNSLPCNVCGVIKPFIPTYVCARCVFVVHQDCIYFPYVIRISRHQHRISFTSSLPSGKWSCGVCRKEVDNDCGAYSCNKCDGYFVHSRCALREDLWDGVELEGVPEEPEIVVEPFQTISDGIILHFSHGHHLKIEISRVYDDEKFCQACMIPIFEGSYYSCMDNCDFILHEGCASSPLKKHHPLLAHSLELKVVTDNYDRGYGNFCCGACRRDSCGFVYESLVNYWRLDVRCASISEPFKYEGHAHPLFLALTPEEQESALCHICRNTSGTSDLHKKLNCIECDYVICFMCATLPYKARYKYDNHVLTFREGKGQSDQVGWCEVCERKMVYSRQKGFYACDDYCCTTLHVYCLLGANPYMKPGQTLYINQQTFKILPNNTMSRPYCYNRRCYVDRCIYRVVFLTENRTFCSFFCAN